MADLLDRALAAIREARGEQSPGTPAKNGTLSAMRGVERCGYCGSLNIASWIHELWCRDCGNSTVKTTAVLRYSDSHVH
jgi:hypothetical protein